MPEKSIKKSLVNFGSEDERNSIIFKFRKDYIYLFVKPLFLFKNHKLTILSTEYKGYILIL